MHAMFHDFSISLQQVSGRQFCPDIPPQECNPEAELCEEGSDCETGICCLAYDCPPNFGVCRLLTKAEQKKMGSF